MADAFAIDQRKFVQGIAERHTPENALVLLAGYDWRAADCVVSANKWLRKASARYQARSSAKKALKRACNNHGRLSGYLTNFHKKNLKNKGAEFALKEIERINTRLRLCRGVSAALDESEVKDMAKAKAFRCETLVRLSGKKHAGDLSEMFADVKAFCAEFGIELTPKADTAAAVMGCIARAQCDKWWRRQLRKVAGRKTEAAIREVGGVRFGVSPYISEYSYKKWQQRQISNAEMMGDYEAVSGEGLDCVKVPLADAIAASVSNPINRRNELMTRMRGYEEVATAMGFVGQFYTLTAPSKYHAQIKAGRANSKFNGSTPVDTMAYLNGVWSRIRAHWAREDIRGFGFRVAEPHHDGTPHFHLMIFLPEDVAARAAAVFGKHALKEDGNENGAQKNRWNVKQIDPALGSAAGYMSKYVAKNIDGFSVDYDHEGGTDGNSGSLRVRAWASLWGIRQFQQIGTASVSVWRELRRKGFDELGLDSEELREVHSAADRGEWARFVEALGGALAKREELLLRPEYLEGDAENTYAEKIKKLVGLLVNLDGMAVARRVLVTRDRIWTVQRRDAENKAAQPPPRTCDNNCTR
ncbi:replication endonuclease [Bacterioplanoides sp.]|uniref:replication endonuclease n=1 Tax=Bacterioplanoides sp. TaxID=2066072 RepID=UPI003AFF66B3